MRRAGHRDVPLADADGVVEGVGVVCRVVVERLVAQMAAALPLQECVALDGAIFNTVFVALLTDALGWLDTSLASLFVSGFPVVGPIPDSGVYRRVDPPASAAVQGSLTACHTGGPRSCAVSPGPWGARRASLGCLGVARVRPGGSAPASAATTTPALYVFAVVSWAWA